jgi:hypothetical protein
VAEQDAVDACGKHLVKHPGIGADRRFIGAIDRDIHDHGRSAMPALGGNDEETRRKAKLPVRDGLHGVALLGRADYSATEEIRMDAERLGV